jgi:hypothetical protein
MPLQMQSMISETKIRPNYLPSSRMRMRSLPVSLVMLVCATIVTAAVFFGMLASGIYPAVASIGVPGMTISVGASAAVRHSHMRNRYLAAALGLLTGLIGYAGYFHLDQCLRWGAPWSAIDRLPAYVAFRISTDQWVHVQQHLALQARRPAAGVQPQAPIVNAAWLSTYGLNFCWELVIVGGCGVVAGWHFAGLPYSERRQQWLQKEWCRLDEASARTLREALAGESIERWLASGPRKAAINERHTTLTVWFLPAAAGEEIDAEAYARLGDGPYQRLEPRETAALITLFPRLQEIAGSSKQQLATQAERETDIPTARIQSLPPPGSGHAVTAKNRQIAELIMEGVQFGIPVLGIALTIGSLFAVALLEQAGFIPQVPGWMAVVPLLIGGFGSLIALRLCIDPKRGWAVRVRTRFQRRQLDRVLRERTDPLIRADDERALFAMVVPRQYWEALRNAPLGEFDHGLVRVDLDSQAILFEGDRERYWIPAAAILDCSFESLVVARESSALAAVVVQARMGTGIWEFPFIPLGRVDQNWRQASQLLQQVGELRDLNLREEPDPVHA